ncbi:hypothetical protein TNCV_3995731 [Trichonephila clavipes]|nr:hypothetical protein TNCV_3995731 [Trichonephila clavipes]
MVTEDVQCLATNPASNCVLTIIEDVSGDIQENVPILLSLLYATQALNQKLCTGVSFLLTAGLVWSSSEATWSTATRRSHSENCFAAVPSAALRPYFSAG